MELIRPYELIHLIDRNCPECDGDIDYNANSNNLFCVCCGKSWDYMFYKYCKIAWEEDPADYIRKMDYNQL